MHTRRHVTGDGSGSPLVRRFAAIRAEFDVPPAFASDVLDEAETAARQSPNGLPESTEPFFTLDPPGSMDLDQAMHLSRDGEGFRVRYAIADLPGYVTPGGAVDREARERGVTVYAPDARVPLHPPVLSEGAASLLPGALRAAYVWDIRLDAAGEIADVDLERRLIRSVARMDYPSIQRELDRGVPDSQLILLRKIGMLRIDRETARGGASLALPDQEVVRQPGGWTVTFVPPLAVEDWNAQISLLTGIAAARLMVDAGVGILRTMPAADPKALKDLRSVAAALGIDWPAARPYGEVLRSLDRSDPRHLAFVHRAARLFRGAAYTVLNGSTSAPAPEHAALATPYAHVTAPLRRLVDRFTLVICDALHHGHAVPDWVTEALPTLPKTMSAADRRAGGVERACVDAVEAAVLSAWIGRRVPGVVIDRVDDTRVLVQLTRLGVEARATGRAPVGSPVEVEVVAASIDAGTVELRLAG